MKPIGLTTSSAREGDILYCPGCDACVLRVLRDIDVWDPARVSAVEGVSPYQDPQAGDFIGCPDCGTGGLINRRTKRRMYGC